MKRERVRCETSETRTTDNRMVAIKGKPMKQGGEREISRRKGAVKEK